MDSLPIIAFVEKIVYTATGKYLNVIQKQIVLGTMMDKSYLVHPNLLCYKPFKFLLSLISPDLV
jgi:hypothetical protein